MCGRSCGRITFHVRSHGDVLWSVCESSTFVLWWISQFHVSRVRMVCPNRVCDSLWESCHSFADQKRFRLFPRICVGVSEGDPDQDLNGKRWTASRPDVPDPAVRRPQHWRWAFIRRVAVYFGSMLPGVIVFLCYQEQIHFVHQSILTTMSVRNGNSTCCAK